MNKFSWQTPEYIHTEKTSDWYSVVSIITAGLAITSLIFGNFLFALVIVISVFSLTLFTFRKPHTITIEINEKGVSVDKIHYPYKTLESFGIDEEHHHGNRLFLKSKKTIMPLITLPLLDQNIDDVRTFLLTHLKEENFEQSLLHTIFEKLGF